jgi:hypothetical protein
MLPAKVVEKCRSGLSVTGLYVIEAAANSLHCLGEVVPLPVEISPEGLI